ncbi:MAG: hypothetical protein ABJP82_22575 [Hyphomicrobiales bacterium]
MSSPAKDVCELLFAASSHTSSFWKFYITICLAIVGYVFASEQSLESVFNRIAVLIAFLTFAVANCSAIIRAQKQWIAIHRTCIEDAADHFQEDHVLVESLRSTVPTDVSRVMAFHACNDAAIALIILVVPVL